MLMLQQHSNCSSQPQGWFGPTLRLHRGEADCSISNPPSRAFLRPNRPYAKPPTPTVRTLQVFFNLQTFYREILGREVLDPPALDITRVARESSPEGIRALVQLLVGAAVSCGGKANYIQAIMQVLLLTWRRCNPSELFKRPFGVPRMSVFLQEKILSEIKPIDSFVLVNKVMRLFEC